MSTEPPSLLLTFDVPLKRASQDRLVASVDGGDGGWEDLYCENTFIDPVTRTLMLLPPAMTGAWTEEPATGLNARLAKSDYTLTTPDNWTENPRVMAGDIYLESGGINEVVTTTATYPRNRSFYLSTFVYGISTNKAIILEAGWGAPGDGVSIRLSADGNVQVWKDETQVGEYDIGSATDLAGVQKKKGKAASVAGQTVEIFLIPSRARDLLVLTNYGSGFCHTFEDLDGTTGETQTITAPGPFWWNVPSGKASVQCAPLRFPDAGAALGSITTLPFAPPTDATFDPITSYNTAGYGTQEAEFFLLEPNDEVLDEFGISGLSEFVANGAKRSVQVMAQLSGDTFSTPFVYACDMVRDRVATQTADAPFDLTPFVTRLRLEVSEEGKATLNFAAYDIGTLEAYGLAQPGRIGDRPVRLALVTPTASGSVSCDIFRGAAGKPDITRGGGRGPLAGATDELSWEAEDQTKQFELYRFRSTLPLDDFTLSNAFRDLARLPGFDDSDLDITNDPFRLPFSPAVSTGDWQFMPERADALSDWIERLHHDYAATWFLGWTPTAASANGYKWRARSPESLSDEPVVRLYQNGADAVNAGVPDALIASCLIRELRERPEESEANQIIVIGQDPGTKRFIFSEFDDAESQAAETLPIDRPGNWRGQLVTYQLMDPYITTQAAADRARAIIAGRVAVERYIIEFDSDLLMKQGGANEGVPLWRGDVVRIMSGSGGAGFETPFAYGDFRIIALSFESVNEADGYEFRHATYRAEYLLDTGGIFSGDGSDTGGGGSTSSLVGGDYISGGGPPFYPMI